MLQRTYNDDKKKQTGFSLIELLIAMTITLGVTAIAATMLATSMNVRTRENARTDSIADVQRGLNTMVREISIGGYGFDAPSNGLVVGDCDNSSIRVRSNLNRYTQNSTSIEGTAEDIKYLVDSTNDQNYLVRFDRFAPAGNQTTVLANRVDRLDVVYLGVGNTVLNVAFEPSQVVNAVALRIKVSVDLPAVGAPGSPGYQPPTTIELESDVALRNKTENLAAY